MKRLRLNALIEARSCEQSILLPENLTDEGLCKFYHELMISEAGRYRTFIELAEPYVNPDPIRARQVRRRWKEILATIEVRGDRMH